MVLEELKSLEAGANVYKTDRADVGEARRGGSDEQRDQAVEFINAERYES